jgi:hypothetical protein
MYSDIIANLSAAGFLGLAFGSGVLYQRVQEIKDSLENFKTETTHECEKRHENDRGVIETLATLSTQVEILIQGQREFRRATDKSFAEAAREKSNS